MNNTFIQNLKTATNYKLTENGAIAHKTTMSNLYDLFAFGGAYRQRDDADCIVLFQKALAEDEVYALKCLFYLRDVRGGQGERRFFRVCMKWLANKHPEIARRNLELIPEYGRYDDLYTFVGTPLENDAFKYMKKVLALDVQSKTPSLLAKWLKSENASSAETRALANKTRRYLGMDHKQYRKTLSVLRERINVLERLMSANEWDKIEFDKIPSKAGLIYKNAFARRDIIKAKYEAFAKDENTKVNAGTLYPYEVVAQAEKYEKEHASYYYRSTHPAVDFNDPERLMINKYWDNLTDYFNGANFNGMAVVDTSGSMTWGCSKIKPIDVAISLGMYCAERAHGPFANKYISFSRNPRLVEIEGVDFCDKVHRIYNDNLCENTNLEATFDLVLNTAKYNHMKQEDLPQNLIIISDMEIDMARCTRVINMETTMEAIRKKWECNGYHMPHLIYWNVNARNDTILDKNDGCTYVSGASPVIFEQILKGKTGYSLMKDKLDSPRYSAIH